MKQKKLITGALVMTMALIASTSAYALVSKENTKSIQPKGNDSLILDQSSLSSDKNATYSDSISLEVDDAFTFDLSDPSNLSGDENVNWVDSVQDGVPQ